MAEGEREMTIETARRVSSQWWSHLAPRHQVNAEQFAAETALLKRLRRRAEPVPDWAQCVRDQMPGEHLEICAHGWLDGLDRLIHMIGGESCHPLISGTCEDVPGRVIHAAEQRAAAVQRWLEGQPDPSSDLDRTVGEWLGRPTPAKRQAAACFVEVVRALLFKSREEAEAVSGRWRARVNSNKALAALFFGEGLDRGLHPCGFQTVPRLDLFLRMIGGDYSHLDETRWFCDAQLRAVLRDDPDRIHVTRGYLWGFHAYLAGHDDDRLRREHPHGAGAALYALHGVSRAGPPTPLRRWLVASLLSTTKYWYQRALAFADPVPARLRCVPSLEGIAAAAPSSADTQGQPPDGSEP